MLSTVHTHAKTDDHELSKIWQLKLAAPSALKLKDAHEIRTRELLVMCTSHSEPEAANTLRP